MFDESKVKYHLEVSQDDQDVRGNVLASGCDECDKRAEDEVIDRLDNGDVWAWALVRVVATYEGIDDIEGDAYLGCCVYYGPGDFKANSCYYEDLKLEACNELREKLEHIVSKIGG